MPTWILVCICLIGALFAIKLLYLDTAGLVLPVTRGALFIPTPSIRIKTLLDSMPIDWDEEQVIRRISMVKSGTRIQMTKGYRGVSGTVIEKTESQFEFYMIRLDNGINIIVGPSAFIVEETPGHKES